MRGSISASLSIAEFEHLNQLLPEGKLELGTHIDEGGYWAGVLL